MPWNETHVMDLKVQLVSDYLQGAGSISDLARAYQVSRKTVHKWLARYQAEGPQGLEERSRAPKQCPHALPEELAAMIVATKRQHLGWGPKKVLDKLRRHYPEMPWPADSTAGELLKREGLVQPRKRKRRIPADLMPLSSGEDVNQSWSADFKGEFRLKNQQLCYPLTITDNASRYLLACKGLSGTGHDDTRLWFERTFREFGLPASIRTDNGTPFASRALGGLSRLSKWWVDLGIRPERTRPGTPQENGRHERMHRSLKDGVCRNPGQTLRQQQARFDGFRREYNEERSHEGIGRRTPDSVYHASTRPYPAVILPPEYETEARVRSVRHNGEFKWKGQLIYVSAVLAQQRISLMAVEDGIWEVRYRFHLLGRFDERQMKIEPVTTWRAR